MAKKKKAVTMADIAERMDVSIVTVSKALSGQKGVSEQVREEIVSLAREMGYRMAQSGAKQEKKTGYRIGVLIPDSAQGTYDSFYWRMYQAVSDGAIQQNCFAGYEGLSAEMTQKKILPRLIADHMADGLIVIGKPEDAYIAFLKKEVHVPMVFLDFYEESAEVDSFVSDGFYGTYFLTNLLLEKGHEKIAYVGTLFATQSITDRYLGYLKSLMEHRIAPRGDYVIPDRSLEDGTSENYEEFELPEELPTAFVCNCDFTASLLIRELGKKGLRVPEDVSVVGFDRYLGNPLYQETEITTYAVDIPAMARAAVDSLIRQMDGAKVQKGLHVVEGYLVDQGSVAAPRVRGGSVAKGVRSGKDGEYDRESSV